MGSFPVSLGILKFILVAWDLGNLDPEMYINVYLLWDIVDPGS